jgi:GrpB-like predicted nucleotidyltransferase (UPF0157 family)
MAMKSSDGGWTGIPKMSFEGYDKGYPLAFARLVDEVHRVLPLVRVEHVGSTSVPGLGGRRVLDGVVVSNPEDHERFREKLLSIGFADFPWAHIKPMLKGSIQFNGKEFPVLLYLLPAEHEYVKGWIAFREYMRRHPEEIEKYARVKQAAIRNGQSDPGSYQQAKTPYLEDLAKRIASEK